MQSSSHTISKQNLKPIVFFTQYPNENTLVYSDPPFNKDNDVLICDEPNIYTVPRPGKFVFF